MKVAIVTNKTMKSEAVTDRLTTLIEKSKTITIDEENPEIVLTIGGDGTLLRAFHHFKESLDKVSFVGVHTGHLGFYTDWVEDEIEEMLTTIETNQFKYVSYPLLSLEIEETTGAKTEFLSLNEATIRKSSATMMCKVYISGDFFENFRGDGLAVSTPTGSTAYNKSIGGAVVHPSVQSLQLSEIASINNNVYRTLGSSLIVGQKEDLVIEIVDSEGTILTVDNMELPFNTLKKATFKISEKRVRFVSGKHMNFWKRVHGSFIGDEEE